MACPRGVARANVATICACVMMAVAGFSGCGGGSSTGPAPVGAIAVTLGPGSATVQASQTASFSAKVTNDPKNDGTTWTLSGSGCMGAACGKLSGASSASGVPVTYTAPAAVPNPPTVTLTATAVDDSTKSAKATITLTPASGTTGTSTSVSVTPGTANLATGGVTQTFTANVANDPQNLGVTWSISGTNCMGALCGSISPTTTASGVAATYTSAGRATASGTVTVTATSVAEASAFGTAAVTLAAPAAPTVTAPTTFSPVNVDSGFGIPAIATDSSGNIDLAWLNTDGVHFTRSTDGGTTFSAPIVITSDFSKNLQNNLLRMVVDPVGDIDLLWYRVLDISDTTVGYNISRSMDNGATFTAPVQFTSGPQPITGSNVPTIVGRPDGKLVVTWIDASSNVLAEATNDGVTFTAPTTIAPAVPGATGEQAVADSAGHVYVFWATAPTVSNCSISFSASSDGVTYSAGKTISGAAGACNSQVSASVGSTGFLAVTWLADSTSLFFTLSLDGGATFATPISITTPANPASNEVVSGADGGIYVLWTAGGTTEFASSPEPGAPFSSPPAALGVATAGGSASLSADACSNVTVIGANGATAYQRSNDGGATFSAPVTISQSNQDFEQQLAADKFGNVNFTWADDNNEEVDFVRLPTACHIP
jgi:hypothetical protein